MSGYRIPAETPFTGRSMRDHSDSRIWRLYYRLSVLVFGGIIACAYLLPWVEAHLLMAPKRHWQPQNVGRYHFVGRSIQEVDAQFGPPTQVRALHSGIQYRTYGIDGQMYRGEFDITGRALLVVPMDLH